MALGRKGRIVLGAYLFLIPNLLGFLIFTSFPVLVSLGLSFFKWDLFTSPKFVGAKNFVKLLGFHRLEATPDSPSTPFLIVAAILLTCILVIPLFLAGKKFQRNQEKAGWLMIGVSSLALIGLCFLANEVLEIMWPNDPEFWYYTFNTIFLMLGIPISIMGSLFLAIVMNQKLRGIAIFRTIYFMPSIVAGIAVYLLWKWIYNPDYGFINSVIDNWFPDWLNATVYFCCEFVGNLFFDRPLEWPPNWLASIGWAKPALMIMGFWIAVGGYNMVLYLAALQGVPLELYEAADIDGAGPWVKFWHITWPMVSPTTFFILTMSIIGGFQWGFEQAYVMTGGGPAGATTTLSYYIYNHAFRWQHMGYAAAISWVLFGAVFLVTMLNWRFGGKVVHY